MLIAFIVYCAQEPAGRWLTARCLRASPFMPTPIYPR
jgi:hypothetical protein